MQARQPFPGCFASIGGLFMKKFITISASLSLIIALVITSVMSAAAAVYVQDGKYKYQIYDDGTVALAGYTSGTVDDVVIPRSYNGAPVTAITNFALEGSTKVRTVDFMEAPDLSKIGMYAFSGCSSLESILVPDSITTVDVSAFRGCTALTDVTFYGNNNVVPAEAFYQCTALRSVRLSAYLKSIQSHAFAGCTSLEYLELLDTVTYIAPNAFEGDDNLTLGIYYGSYAHQYAIDNSVSYRLLDGVKLGDVNGDGSIDVNDVTLIQKHIAGLSTLKGIYLYAANTNLDEDVDIIDATVTQKSIAGYELPYPVGEVITE